MEPHICICDDCNPEPYVDACKYEAALNEIVGYVTDCLDGGKHSALEHIATIANDALARQEAPE